MSKIFVSVGHSGVESYFALEAQVKSSHQVLAEAFLGQGKVHSGGGIYPAVDLPSTMTLRQKEDLELSAEATALRDLVVAELRSRGFLVEVTDHSFQTLAHLVEINAQAEPKDIALLIQGGTCITAPERGLGIFHIANNEVRKRQADLLLSAIVRRVPELAYRPTRPDTSTALGYLPFCRALAIPSLVLELGCFKREGDLQVLQMRRRDYAIGVADGLQVWLKDNLGIPTGVSQPTRTPRLALTNADVYPEIRINLNGQMHEEKGILVNGNAFVPMDLVDRLGINLHQSFDLYRLRYRHIVYVRAIGLRDAGVVVRWDSTTQVLNLQTIFKICTAQMERIMGVGYSSDVQMMMFLKNHNEEVLTNYSDLPHLYREEAAIEGVNHDLAFCQMCLETNFLRFTDATIKPEQNNFAGLGASGFLGASFPDKRTGVRAHIQRLKGYGSTAPIVQAIVDPRFNTLVRGIAPTLTELAGRWSINPFYDRKIAVLLRQLYETSGILG
ncbi:MAG: glucosaminidase domain-containing protein [Pseudanabaenaceae cyanobacterium]